MINKQAEKKFEEVKNLTKNKDKEIKEYLSMLPDNSSLKAKFNKLSESNLSINSIFNKIKDNLSMGSIDVNIMTKIDKEHFTKDGKLPAEFNDAHAALRGYANSDLSSSMVLSAGMNPRLYSYIEKFKDFFPDNNFNIKKKITLKVSDFRSALIQGKFLAKKGIWVSEYRVESGLNCGGHAFASDGNLLGPVLAQFKEKREELSSSIHEVLYKALKSDNKPVPETAMPIKISAQGGVGTSEEHNFIIDQYNIDSIGWGTPFLLVPEATCVDKNTLEKLENAKEDDLYLSNISPMGVPFNNLRGNTRDIEKFESIKNGTPGSSCTKQYVSLNTEFTEHGICTASRQYQRLKIQEIDNENLSPEEYKKKYDKIVEKSCICVGLGTPALLVNNLDTKTEGEGVSICPGPNMAYFSKTMSLKNITDHIYGRDNMISRTDRPNMFIKELEIYIDYFRDKIEDSKDSMTKKQIKYLVGYSKNLSEGIEYYYSLFLNTDKKLSQDKDSIFKDLDKYSKELNLLNQKIEAFAI
jgi:hypothetical protein